MGNDPFGVSIPFKRESISKVRYLRWLKRKSRYSFNSLQTGKYIQRITRRITNAYQIYPVSIPFKRESISKAWIKPSMCPFASSFNSLQTGKYIQRDPILSPVGPWLRKPKNIREVHTAFFFSKFSPKIPQTHVYTELYAIFLQKRLESYTLSGFLGNLHRGRL